MTEHLVAISDDGSEVKFARGSFDNKHRYLFRCDTQRTTVATDVILPVIDCFIYANNSDEALEILSEIIEQTGWKLKDS